MLRTPRVTFRQSIPTVLAGVLLLTLCNAGCEKRIREPGSFNRPVAPLEEPAPSTPEPAAQSANQPADVE